MKTLMFVICLVAAYKLMAGESVSDAIANRQLRQEAKELANAEKCTCPYLRKDLVCEDEEKLPLSQDSEKWRKEHHE